MVAVVSGETHRPGVRRSYSLASLFSGAGGLDCGFDLTGRFKVVLANDIVVPAAESFSRNFRLPVAPVGKPLKKPAVYLGSIERLDFSAVVGGDTDIVVGGPPCQDFSIVRGPSWDRRGIEVKRGRLYAHFIRALVELQPKMFVFENVPGLVSANAGKALEVILADFANLSARWEEIRDIVGNDRTRRTPGYSLIFCGVVDSSKIGVPQARRRLVLIGVRRDLAERSDLYHFATFAKTVLTGRDRLIGTYPLTPLEVFEGKPLPDLAQRYNEIMEEYGELCRRNSGGSEKRDVVDDYLELNGISLRVPAELDRAFAEHEAVLRELGYLGRPLAGVEFPDGSNIVPEEDQDVLARMRQIPPGANHEVVRGTKWEVEGRGISLIYRRIHPLRPAYTVVAFGGGGTWGYHYERGRSKLTNRERARLQTFPDSFLFEGRVQQVRAQIGEAVPPLLAKRIAEICLSVLDNAGTEISPQRARAGVK
jgi:DNA (cytosine-5)-methyltransferase 1